MKRMVGFEWIILEVNFQKNVLEAWFWKTFPGVLKINEADRKGIEKWWRGTDNVTNEAVVTYFFLISFLGKVKRRNNN